MIYQIPPLITSSNTTDEETVSTAVVTLVLANNTMYTLSNASITSISLSASTNLKYCGLDFSTPSSAPQFDYPGDGATAWVFLGDDCESGIFQVAASSRYRIAIEACFNTFVGTVQKVIELT